MADRQKKAISEGPLDNSTRVKDTVLGGLGNKESKFRQTHALKAKKIKQEWENQQLKPSVTLLTKWLTKRGVDLDVAQRAFEEIGVDSTDFNALVRSFDKDNDGISNDKPGMPEILGQWMEREFIKPTTFTLEQALSFLEDHGVDKGKASSLVKRIGITNGRIISKEQREDLAKIVQHHGNVEPTPAQDKVTPENSIKDVFRRVETKYKLDAAQLDALAQDLRIDRTATDEMGDERFRRLMGTLKSAQEQGEIDNLEDNYGTEQQVIDIIGKKYYKEALETAKKVTKNTSDIAGLDDLEKMGLAALISWGKARIR